MLAWLARLEARARSLKTELHVLYLAARDPRTPRAARWLIAAALAYALSPIDLIPDFIPVLGWLDELLLLPLALTIAIRLIPPEVIADCRQTLLAMEREGLPQSRTAAFMIFMIWLSLMAVAACWAYDLLAVKSVLS